MARVPQRNELVQLERDRAMAISEEGTIQSVRDLLDHLNTLAFTRESHSHNKVWFRGAADVGRFKLVPGVYRSNFPGATEDERLLHECHLTQDFRVRSAGLIGDNCSDAKLYFLQQHYSMPTRLLDWTNNALAGLYFAVSSAPSTDGALYIMDAYILGTDQKAKYPRGGGNV